MKKIVITISILVTAVTVKVGHSEYQKYDILKKEYQQLENKYYLLTLKYSKAVLEEQQVMAADDFYLYADFSSHTKEKTRVADTYKDSVNKALIKYEEYHNRINKGFWNSIFNTFDK